MTAESDLKLEKHFQFIGGEHARIVAYLSRLNTDPGTIPRVFYPVQTGFQKKINNSCNHFIFREYTIERTQ